MLLAPATLLPRTQMLDGRSFLPTRTPRDAVSRGVFLFWAAGPCYDRVMDTSTPQSIKARSVINNGLRDGKIQKPDTCDGCGKKTGGLEAHHPRGDKHPDVIVWLCLDCHGAAHAGRDKHLSDSPVNKVKRGFRQAAADAMKER